MKSYILSLLPIVAACLVTNGEGHLNDTDGNQEYVSIGIYQVEYSGRELPCPIAEDIAPCVCTYDSRTNAMDLDCSAVDSEDQLRQIFQADFPVKNFRKFLLMSNNKLKVLESYVFNDISFERITITLCDLEIIEMDALESCYETATEIYVHFNKITSFPFHSLSQFLKLTDFQIYGNSLSTIPANAFNGLTKLEYLGLGTNTPNIVGTFENLPSLWGITLGGCHLTTIPENFLKTGSSDLKFISLQFNTIDYVEPGAFDIVEDLAIYMNFNSLVTLEEETWRPFLEGGVRLDGRNNPLVCGCDIAWLFDEDNLVQQIGEDTKCSDGKVIHDLDQSNFDDC